VLVLDQPVMTVTANPTQRVLRSPTRDANPFFHLFESIWMLAGRSDGVFLDRWVRNFSERFGDNHLDGLIWGAYGHRWRRSFDYDQIQVAVTRLRRNMLDRRVVIAMWDPNMDIWDPEELDESTNQPFPEPADLPCNTHIYPRVVGGCLDLTVCCRSNDAIWGAHGANAVHFSVLQEYMAAAIGVRVGTLYQLSNNYHAYTDNFSVEKMQQIIRETPEPYGPTLPMVAEPGHFLRDCEVFCGLVEHSDPGPLLRQSDMSGDNPWFHLVAAPLLLAHREWRESGDVDAAVEMLRRMPAIDWRTAAVEWLERRRKA
jgi:thymidylate synthase